MEINAASCARAEEDSAVGDHSSLDLNKISGAVHFIGIGGIGMSAIARLLLAEGRSVSGSDKAASEITEELEQLGARVFIGHKAENVEGAGVVVVSTAIDQANPELALAHEKNLPILHRSDLLALLSRASKLIAISGTHGKTTTTGMVAQILMGCGLDPSVVVGGIFEAIGSNSRYGRSGYFVAETDESDRTHAKVTSYIAVLTNIEADHLENYPGGIEQIRDVMVSFANHSERAVIACVDDPGCRAVLANIKRPVITYGKHGSEHKPVYAYESLPADAGKSAARAGATETRCDTSENGASSSALFGMRIYKNGTALGDVALSVPGEHNKSNALAAIAVALELNAEFSQIASAIASFKGVDRRFQIVGEHDGILVVDDYAHHPTEVVAVLKAARQFIEETRKNGAPTYKRVVALFQPHQPGRLRDFWNDFSKSFDSADMALITDVYVARGGEIEGINAERFVQCVNHPDVHYIQGPASTLAEGVLSRLQPGDLVITIGAGDITKVAPELLKLLKQDRPGGRSK